MENANIDDGVIISELKEQIKRMESRIIGLENQGKPASLHDFSSFNEIDDSTHYGQVDDTDLPAHLSYLPQVRKCNFMEFKNRFCDEDGRYAVDALVSGDFFKQEYLEEQRFRDKLFEHGKLDSKEMKRKVKALVKETEKSSNAFRSDQSGRTWVQRIRLQAPALLQTLAKIQGESWSSRPRTYNRPFCTLVHFHDQVKQVLGELEKKWAFPREDQGRDGSGGPPKLQKTVPEALEVDFHDDTFNTLAILKAYVKFMDEEVMPDSRRFNNLEFPINQTIPFSDLYYLFKPGDFIYRPLEGEQAGEKIDHRMGQRIWRVYFVKDAIKSFNFQSLDHENPSDSEGIEDDSIYFTVHAYHIDFTGDEFCIVPHVFKISPYDGEQSVTALPIQPFRLDQIDKTSMMSSLSVGNSVLKFIESKHAFYNDWSVIRTATGDFITDASGLAVTHPEYINSEAMVDFQEAFNANPPWRPMRIVLKAEYSHKTSVTDDFTILWWSGRDRARLIRETRETVPLRTGVHNMRRNKFVLEDSFLVSVAQNYERGQPTTKKFLRMEEKILMFCRVYAYVFRERKFVQLDVSRLEPSVRNPSALDSLKIDGMMKKLIQGSVRGHFLQKEAEGSKGEEGPSLDLIQGKGTGLFILLHGVPGVGKTATAEAVAQANGKPLFKITCGDIGLTPAQVESSLRAIFRLASIWDCILLMDEVDTFFSQRSKGDSAITKNALVSVFLRVLDYYTGILFLTTNRAGALDEAFKSRIHYKIYYPQLSKNQTIDIWKLNIQKLQEISEQSREKRPMEILSNEILRFAEYQFDDSKRKGIGCWNGRQIRNAFQVARSLAYYDALSKVEQPLTINAKQQPPPAILNTKYFEMMHEITESFDKYMLEVFSGQNDGDLALEMEHRADHFRQRPSRSEWDEYDNEYQVNNNQGYSRSGNPFDMGLRPGYNEQRRSSQRTDGLSVSGLSGPPHRYSQGSIQPTYTAGYDEARIDDQGPVSGSQRLFQKSEHSTGSPAPDPEYGLQQNSHSVTYQDRMNVNRGQDHNHSPFQNWRDR